MGDPFYFPSIILFLKWIGSLPDLSEIVNDIKLVLFSALTTDKVKFILVKKVSIFV